ncbi:hypothetical protein D3C76_1453790 [compost metagenome]
MCQLRPKIICLSAVVRHLCAVHSGLFGGLFEPKDLIDDVLCTCRKVVPCESGLLDLQLFGSAFCCIFTLCLCFQQVDDIVDICVRVPLVRILAIQQL